MLPFFLIVLFGWWPSFSHLRTFTSLEQWKKRIYWGLYYPIMWGLFCKPLKVIRIPGSLLKKPGFDSMEKIRDPDFLKIMTFHFTVGFPVKLPGGWDSTLSAATAVLGSLRGAQQWRSARHSWQELQVPPGFDGRIFGKTWASNSWELLLSFPK